MTCPICMTDNNRVMKAGEKPVRKCMNCSTLFLPDGTVIGMGDYKEAEHDEVQAGDH